MGLCFAFMWVVSMYQMWFSPTPSPVAQRESGDLPADRLTRSRRRIAGSGIGGKEL